MDIDVANESDWRLTKPGDALAGDPKQDHLPLKPAWVESPIKDLHGRNGTGSGRRKVEDCTAPPTRRNGGVADPYIHDPVCGGIHHDPFRTAADAHDLESKARDDHLPVGYGESQPPDDAVVVRLHSDGSGGRCSSGEFRLVLHQIFV